MISREWRGEQKLINSLKFAKAFSVKIINTFRPNPGRREKINSNFYFHTSVRCLKRFYEGLTVSDVFRGLGQGALWNKCVRLILKKTIPVDPPNAFVLLATLLSPLARLSHFAFNCAADLGSSLSLCVVDSWRARVVDSLRETVWVRTRSCSILVDEDHSGRSSDIFRGDVFLKVDFY